LVAGFDVASSSLTGCLEVFPAWCRAEVCECSEETAALGRWASDLAGDDAQMRAGWQMETHQLGGVDDARAISADHEVKSLGVLLG
jgi:hypothetical protein